MADDNNSISSPFTPDRHFRNPVMRAQQLDAIFSLDPYLGFKAPTGKDFLGESKYLSMEDCIKEIKGAGKRTILNIGDSSTSGWDSNIVTVNRQRAAEDKPLLSTFFQYKTYSDYLRELTKSDFYVINAGVPAYTSFQGWRRLKLLLEAFRKQAIQIDITTAYFGNNDSVWDHNRQDKDWIGRKSVIKRPFNLVASGVATRVLPLDYQANVQKIISICQQYQSKLILIEPVTPIYWKPGTRVVGEDLKRSLYHGSFHAYQYLDRSIELWNHALKQEYSETQQLLLEEAREQDFILPRIKRDFLRVFRDLAHATSTPYAQINLDRSQDDIRYFIDYCHPIGDANKKISEAIANLIDQALNTNFGSYKLEDSRKSHIEEDALGIPVCHYPLY